MSQVFLSLLTILLANQAMATSAIRFPGESYQEASRRNSKNTGIDLMRTQESAEYHAQELTDIDLSQVPSLETFAEVVELYQYVRDRQFIEYKEKMRRSSWFYPDNGCWIRAQLMNENLLDQYSQALNKIFIFGNLEVQTQFSEYGSVSWWYHVAVITRVDEEYFVLDPAMDYTQPLKLEEWMGRQTSDIHSVHIAVCHGDTYQPSSNCLEPRKVDPAIVVRNQTRFFDFEEERLMSLGLPASDYLGEHPPWRTKH